MRAVTLLPLLWALPVAADPVVEVGASPCQVTLLAPAPIRAQLEGQIRGETVCGAALAVEVAPSEGGLRVRAWDLDAGTLREREVPDARTAAVLIASWLADDQIASQGAASTGEASGAVVGGGPAPAAPATGLGAAAAGGAIGGAVDRRATPRAVDEGAVGVAVAVASTVGVEVGLRVEADVRHGAWAAGLALAGRAGTRAEFLGGHADERDLAATAYLALATTHGAWLGRALVGVGAQLTDLRMSNSAGDLWAQGQDHALVAEVSLTVSRSLGGGVALIGGALVTVLPRPIISLASASVRADLGVLTPQLLVGLRWTP
jgi:hypothetical protein